jgi:hypothetical protein
VGVAITEFWGSWSAPEASPCSRPSGQFLIAARPASFDPGAPAARTPSAQPGAETAPRDSMVCAGPRRGRPGRFDGDRRQLMAIGSKAPLGSQRPIPRSLGIQ